MSKERFLKEFSLNRESKQLEKRKIFTTEQKANEIIQQFQHNIQSIREKFHIHDELIQNGKEEHAKDILRSQVVFLMSALDFYMHEIVRYRLLKMFSGELPKTKSYKNFIVSIETLEEALKNPETIDWLSEEIIIRHSHETFMASKAIKKVLALISNEAIYNLTCEELGKENGEVNELIDEIYRRRNQIAHQSDRLHNEDGQNAILKEEVQKFICFIEEFVQKIHDLLMDEEYRA